MSVKAAVHAQPCEKEHGSDNTQHSFKGKQRVKNEGKDPVKHEHVGHVPQPTALQKEDEEASSSTTVPRHVKHESVNSEHSLACEA